MSIAARQKEIATSSVSELVQAVRRPRALSESINRPSRKSGGGKEEERIESLARRNSQSVARPRRNSHASTRGSMQCLSELPERKQRKSSRRSLLGYYILSGMISIHFQMQFLYYTSLFHHRLCISCKLLSHMALLPVISRIIRKSQSNIMVSLDFETDMDDDGSGDDEGLDHADGKVRTKEMRKGIDLATTLERIEKNFVITDPRLPDNPIVRFLLGTICLAPAMFFEFQYAH